MVGWCPAEHVRRGRGEQVHIGFTTVNRTAINENTVALSAVRSPALDELGLDDQERRGLERLGVRNAAELRNLGRSTGVSGMARLARVDRGRLMRALDESTPRVTTVRPEPIVADDPPVKARTPPPADPPPAYVPPADPPPASAPPVFERPPTGFEGRVPLAVEPGRGRVPLDIFTGRVPFEHLEPVMVSPVIAKREVVHVAPGTDAIRIDGRNLLADDVVPRARLDERELPIRHLDDDAVVFELPPGARGGALAIQLGDATVEYDLEARGEDPWEPARA